MNIATKVAAVIFAIAASSPSFAETTLDTSSAGAYRASLNQMSIECDGSGRGPCFLRMLDALKKIETMYFNRFMTGVRGGTAEHTERYNQMEAVRKKEMNGLTRAAIFSRAAAIK